MIWYGIIFDMIYGIIYNIYGIIYVWYNILYIISYDRIYDII